MYNFKHLILHNFGSYGHSELDLCDHGFCLVSGSNNFKQDNATSNGAGKSFLWSAICFVLTGETIQGLRTNLKNINVQEDLCYVQLEFDFNNDSFLITRYIAPKSDLKIIKNNIDISGKGLRESEKKLSEILPDITKDLIASTIIIGQGLPNKFSSFSPSGRKELLEKLTKADFMIEDIKQRVNNRQLELSNKIREHEDKLLVFKTKLVELENKTKLIEKELDSLNGLDYNKEQQCITAEINKLTAKLIDADNQIVNCRKIVEDNNKQQIELLTKKAADEAEELAAYNEASNELIAQKNYLAAEVASLQREITKLEAIKDICPTCGQKLPGVIKPDTTKQHDAVSQKQEQLAKLENKLIIITKKHQEYQKQISADYQGKITAFAKIISENNLRENELNRSKRLLESQKSTKEANLAEIVATLKTKQDKVASLLLSKSSLTAENSSLLSDIKLVEESKVELDEHQLVLKKMDNLIKRDFRGFLLTNLITYIDRRAKDFCEIVFGTRELNVYLDGNLLNIAYYGRLFDNLSGGEKQRVDLILQFAIRDMLQVYLGINANILVLDEITDFLDKKSCAAIMALISKELCSIGSVFIVSHHAEELELPIDSKITIIKNEEGVSSIR